MPYMFGHRPVVCPGALLRKLEHPRGIQLVATEMSKLILIAIVMIHYLETKNAVKLYNR